MEEPIRLLVIRNNQSLDEHAEIRCWIEHFEHSNAPPYYALSYAWGPEDSASILLNDQGLTVRKNLYNALLHLRRTGFYVPDTDDSHFTSYRTTKWIWIDALCIDQKNIQERNQQVSFMGEIYEAAIEVFAWLGSRKDVEDNCHENIVYAMAKLAELPPGGIRHIRDIDFIKLVELFDRPYWQRMWIIQEIMLARRVTLRYDDISIPWHSLTRFQDLLRPGGTAFPLAKVEEKFHWTVEKLRDSHALKLVRHRSCRFHNTMNKLEDWLESFQESICTDPRDKVYALLGLITERNYKPTVRYSKSILEVYMDVINFCLIDTDTRHSKQKIVYISQILQQSFNCPSELSNSAEAYQEALSSNRPNGIQPLIKVQGICAGIIKRLHKPYNHSTQVHSLSRLQPRRNSPATMFRIFPDIVKSIPIDNPTSWAILCQSVFRAKYYTN